MRKTIASFVAAAALGLAGMVSADTWTLDGGSSKLSFGSVKKDVVGEVHSFSGLSGTVGADGQVAIDIDLASVETNIDIRNERMIEHVFKNAPKASLTAELDMDELNAIAVGGSSVIDVEGALAFLGASVDIEAEMFVTRISDAQVMVTTNDMVYLSTEDLGVNAGVDKLMELAKLPGITRTVPFTVRLMFNMDEKKAEAAPAAPATALQVAAVTGDAKAGKKVFKKCKACHKVKEGKNGTGPTLYNIVGAEAGKVDGFRYSKALAGSGITWTPDALAAFLADPKGYAPGNKMSFRGLKKDKDIENVIAYLANP